MSVMASHVFTARLSNLFLSSSTSSFVPATIRRSFSTVSIFSPASFASFPLHVSYQASSVTSPSYVKKLSDLSSSGNPRLIDGIVMTKFDTIGDKVGAALSMVYISGSLVIFVGYGQSYINLKKLNVKAIVKTLLK